MKVIPVGVVSETARLKHDELARVIKVLQKQLTEDVGPIWDIAAELEIFETAKDVPGTHWPLIVRDKLEEEGMLSIHSVEGGRPYTMVAYSEEWSVAASHDLMEMLADPNVDRVAKGPSPEPRRKYDVEYLVQICDPCAAARYEIDGVQVAEFSLPAYWKLGKATAKGKYSFKGTLKKPFEIARGGYMTWRDPKARRWRQQVWWEKAPRINDLGAVESETTAGTGGGSVVVAETHTLAVRFHSVALRAVYKVQAPLFGSARATVERLIQRFG